MPVLTGDRHWYQRYDEPYNDQVETRAKYLPRSTAELHRVGFERLVRHLFHRLVFSLFRRCYFEVREE